MKEIFAKLHILLLKSNSKSKTIQKGKGARKKKEGNLLKENLFKIKLKSRRN